MNAGGGSAGVIVNVNGVSEFRARDVLLIDMSASDVDLRQFCGEQMLEPMVLRGAVFLPIRRWMWDDGGGADPDSEMMGKTVREIAFRTRFGLNIVGMKRDGKAMDGSVVDEPPQLGDILLVVGNWRQLPCWRSAAGISWCSICRLRSMTLRRPTAGPHAIFCLVLMVALMLTDEIPTRLPRLSPVC